MPRRTRSPQSPPVSDNTVGEAPINNTQEGTTITMPTDTAVERIQIQARISQILSDRLAREAERRVVSKNFLIEKAVEIMLEEWEQESL